MAEVTGFPERVALDPEVVRIARTLEDAGYETWAVGGALRDRLLGGGQSDVDLATAATPEVVQRLFRRTVPVGVRFGTVGVLDSGRRLHEVTTFRQDVETDGRHAVVRFGVSLDEDLARRDFTINAIAYHPVREVWRDPFDGFADLRAGLVRAVGVPADRFREDYLRILRGIRFAARFGFRFDPATWDAAVAAAPGLDGLSAERVRDEWTKGLVTARSVAEFCRLWREAGAAAVWLPELDGLPAGADPAPEPRDPVVLTALVCRAPATVLARLRASNHEIARAAAVEEGPAAPEGREDVAVRRWLHRVGTAVDDLVLLAAYRGGTPAWVETVHQVRERGDPTERGDLAVTGHDLLALGVAPGPELGTLLDRLVDEVIRDPSRNRRDDLLAMVRSWR